MNYNDLARSYQKNAIMTASPGKLILMLFDGALRFVHQAKEGFKIEVQARRIEAINNNVMRAQSIIAELQASLNMDIEGDFSMTMYRLYDYMYRLLQDANYKKEVQFLSEVEKILLELRNAWEEMLSKVEPKEKLISSSTTA